MSLARLLSAAALSVTASCAYAQSSETDDEVKNLLETNNCAAHMTSGYAHDHMPDFFIPSLRYIGCALQTISAGENMKNEPLIQHGDLDLRKAVISLQQNLNNYIVDENVLLNDDMKRDKLLISGELDKKTRTAIYEYAIKFGAYDVFTQTAPDNEIGDDVSTLFYLREHLKKLDVDQYIQAMSEAMATFVRPPAPSLLIPEFDTDLCNAQTLLADRAAPCPEI